MQQEDEFRYLTYLLENDLEDLVGINPMAITQPEFMSL